MGLDPLPQLGSIRRGKTKRGHRIATVFNVRHVHGQRAFFGPRITGGPNRAGQNSVTCPDIFDALTVDNVQ